MPSGRTHDAVTCILAAPVAAAAYSLTGTAATAAVVTAAFLFGGLMFGPDLDTRSKPYSRWRFFRFLWFPYRSFFKHRSRWSHGLVCGTLFRTVYFMGIITIVLFAASLAAAQLAGTDMPRLNDFSGAWRLAGGLIQFDRGQNILLLVFAGMWLGAASHTFADMAGTFVKTGRTGRLL